MAEEDGDVKVNVEIEQMLNALGDPTPENLKGDLDDSGDEESAEEKAKREQEEADAEAARAAEGETAEEKEARKKKDADDAAAAAAADEGETDKDKIIENLRQRLNEKSEPSEKKDSQEDIEKKESDKDDQSKKDDKKTEPLKLDEQDFIGDLDLDDLTRDKAALNKILNAVYVKGVNDSKQVITEGVLNTIPDIVKHNLTLLTTLKEASDKFYTDNKDLVPFKRVVATVFEEIAAKNPDKKYSELMNLTAPEVRKRLELHKQAVKKEDKGEIKKVPRLPGAKGGQRQTPSSKPDTSALEKEISEMNSTLRR